MSHSNLWSQAAKCEKLMNKIAIVASANKAVFNGSLEWSPFVYCHYLLLLLVGVYWTIWRHTDARRQRNGKLMWWCRLSVLITLEVGQNYRRKNYEEFIARGKLITLIGFLSVKWMDRRLEYFDCTHDFRQLFVKSTKEKKIRFQWLLRLLQPMDILIRFQIQFWLF